MHLVDIGANLTNSQFSNDLGALFTRSAAAGVGGIVITGTSVEGSCAAHAMACAGHPSVSLYSTAGVHPHNARHWSADAYHALAELARAPQSKVVAIGECGLDFNRDFSPRPAQIQCFNEQLDLAAELGLPLFLHERDAHDSFISILRKNRDRLGHAVVHCFTGTEAALKAYLDLDLHIGITGWVNDHRRGAHLAALLPLIPRNRLMIETDAPYLTPKNLKPWPAAGRNEPAFLPLVLAKVADCLGMHPKEVADATTETAVKFFNLR